MNYMKEIARMLGVELGEEFEIKSVPGKFYINNGGLKLSGREEMKLGATLMCILKGDDEIVKLPWKPKNGDEVWYSSFTYGVVSTIFNSYNSRDLLLYKLGKIYRTEKEALIHADEDKKFWVEIIKELEE